jgi:hypothetical protein
MAENNKGVEQVVNKVFPKGSGLESLGQSLMSSWQNRRNVMEIRDRYHAETSRDKREKIYEEFIDYERNLSGEDKDEAWRGWKNPEDPWYNPGKMMSRRKYLENLAKSRR